jgi:hypothetical protein
MADVDQRARAVGLSLIGDVHAHPSQPDPQPSVNDQEIWRDIADGLKQHYLGIVVGAGFADERFAQPQLRAYVAVHGDNSVRPIPLETEA